MKILIDSRDLALIVYRIEILERIVCAQANQRDARMLVSDLDYREPPSWTMIGDERISEIQREIEEHERSGSGDHETP